MTFRLSINTGFAVNRYAEPEAWIAIVGKKLGIKYAQFTADLLNPSLPDKIIDEQITRIKNACEQYQVQITSTFTGAFTRVNHLAHPDQSIRAYWLEWFKRYIDMTVALGAKNMGSHFGIFTAADNNDLARRAERRQQNIAGWHEVARYAKQKNLDFLSWEPMSISREQGETLSECARLQQDVNQNAPLPFKICLDVDHGDVTSSHADDTNPYAWLQHFGKESPLIHLKQSSANKSGHWPFTKEHNAIGRIQPEKVLQTLKQAGATAADLILELSFREREPVDSQVVSILTESVEYWRTAVPD